ncbi:hypothetical protein, partial [Streptomyces sp. NPDC002276]
MGIWKRLAQRGPWFEKPTAWPVVFLREIFPVIDQCAPSTLVAMPHVLDKVLLYSKEAVAPSRSPPGRRPRTPGRRSRCR